MPIHGDKILLVKTPGGGLKTMRNTVCPCTGALTSVAKMNDSDHMVVFSKRGSFIMHESTGDIDWMTRTKDDSCELELELVPYSEAKPILEKAGFQRRQ